MVPWLNPFQWPFMQVWSCMRWSTCPEYQCTKWFRHEGGRYLVCLLMVTLKKKVLTKLGPKNCTAFMSHLSNYMHAMDLIYGWSQLYDQRIKKIFLYPLLCCWHIMYLPWCWHSLKVSQWVFPIQPHASDTDFYHKAILSMIKIKMAWMWAMRCTK